MLETWAPKSVKAATSCLSIITGASLECPIRCAVGYLGPDWGRVLGQLAAVPSFLLPSHGSVVDWGQVGNVVSLLTAWCGGLTAFSWFPLSLSKCFDGVGHSLCCHMGWLWQGGNVVTLLVAWCPIPGTWNIVGSWGPLCFGHCPVCLWMPGYSPYFVKQWLPYLQQKSCEQRCSGPGQSDHCGSWGRQEYSCPPTLSHDPCVWDYL